MQNVTQNVAKVLANVKGSMENYERISDMLSAIESKSDSEIQKGIIQSANQIQGELDEGEYDCPICFNKGYILRTDSEGHRFGETCRCMRIRYNKRLINKSGLSEMLEENTFDKWQVNSQRKHIVKQAAIAYSKNPQGWFFLSGGPGTGKTHLCTAICKALMEQALPTRYVMWREISTESKSHIMDAEYQNIVGPLKTVKVLYIDDLFKTKKKIPPTDADIMLAFEIINSRSNNTGLLTIISTERSIDDIIQYDEALGSRIYHRAKNYCMSLAGEPNWRLR